jgi:hypothetical protein
MSIVLVAEEIDETAYAAARFATYWVVFRSRMSLHHPLPLEPSCDQTLAHIAQKPGLMVRLQSILSMLMCRPNGACSGRPGLLVVKTNIVSQIGQEK